MIKAILLDLDNTLLNNPDHTFAVEYLKAADRFFARHWGYSNYQTAFRAAIQAMAAPDKSHQQSNYALTVEALAQDTGLPEHEVDAGLREFYATDYTTLQNCITPVDGAAELIAYLKSADYQVVIATNPIYTPEAIQQRLRWAGLVDLFDHYAFVTHAENTHFSKPNPAYFAEILGRIGIEPDEAVLVGDSIRNDMVPANTIGIHTYYVGHKPFEPPSQGRKGTLQSFYDAITGEKWLDTLTPYAHAPQMIAPQLVGNLGALFGMLEHIQPHFWHQHPIPGEWSILQVVCHLAESERTVQRPRLATIRDEDNPFLSPPREPLDADHFYCDDKGYDYANTFAQERQQTLDLLEKLSATDWQRPARHSIFGPTTLLEMAYFTAHHDRLHLNQLCQTLGQCK